MNLLDGQTVCDFVNTRINSFHERRLVRLEEIEIDDILKRKNPYLFRAKNVLTAGELISSIMDAFLSSSEEQMFGGFLEELAVFVSEQTSGGSKSSAQGIDLEFDRSGTRYIVSIKSGINWGNSSQKRRLADDFLRARQVLGQSPSIRNTQPILGICYGRTRTTDNGLYQKIVGQSFWHFLSDNPELYVDIIEPIGYQARQHNAVFGQKRAAIENRFTSAFIERFCSQDGSIDWPQLVAFNSCNIRNI